MSDITLILYKNSKAYDISQLVESINWKGRKGSAARSISVSLLDHTDENNIGIDAARGDQLVFYYKNIELFRGIIMSQQQSSKHKMSITAYDNGIYLANNKDTFVYENKTLHDIFVDVCKRFGLKHSAVDTSYQIPELTKSKTTAWDVIMDAISQDFKATGTKYFVSSSKGVLSLVKRKENMLQWALESGKNISGYTYKKSIEKIKTRLKIYTDEDTVFAIRKNEALEKKIGIFQEIEKKDDDLSEAKLNQHIEETFKEISAPEISLRVETTGIPDVISGTGVYVLIDSLGIKRTFWVDEDSHTFKGGGHTMSLTLNKADE